MSGTEVRTVVVGRRVVEIELEIDDRPHSLGLAVRVDGISRWSSEEPGWRDLGCGVDRDLFVWSARRLVVVPLDPGSEPRTVDCDEDIVAVFRVAPGWLLVCETSVRLTVDRSERSRVELPGVLQVVRWSGARLVVETDHGALGLEVRGDALVASPDA